MWTSRCTTARRTAPPGSTISPGSRVAPTTHFALLANRYIYEYQATPDQFGLVAVKNSRNGSLNPNAQRQKARTLDEVMAPPQISGPLTRLQCCPIGEGAAAAIVVSDEAIRRYGLDSARAVRVPRLGLALGDRLSQ